MHKNVVVAFSCILIFQTKMVSYNNIPLSELVLIQSMPIKNAKWTQKDEQILTKLVQQIGMKKWAEIARIMHHSYSTHKWTGKQCNERWNNHLRADLTINEWNHDDDMLLINLRVQEGNKWVEIARSFPGKSVNNVKNRFYALGRKSFRRMCKFTGTIAKSLNVQSVKPATFSKIFAPHSISSSDQLPITLNQSYDFEELQKISSILIQFMDDKGKNFQVLKQKFSCNQIKHIIQRIFELNNFFNGSQISTRTKNHRKNKGQTGNESQASELQLESESVIEQIPLRQTKQSKTVVESSTKAYLSNTVLINEEIAFMNEEDAVDQRNWSRPCLPIMSAWNSLQNKQQKEELIDNMMEYGLEGYMFIEYDTTPMIKIVDDKTPLASPLGEFQIYHQ